ncbi:hypothetical protein CDEST_00071 [Colletotrichum destructivum]|uniref:Uncharacterized protein n=1 Tax=Colletotrichum destructivum TaxID=34406 RepID=A0AAX4HV85_9PEZI|nr:hypothetical protein CDEST_00071 [Colletotrichum destructivum]
MQINLAKEEQTPAVSDVGKPSSLRLLVTRRRSHGFRPNSPKLSFETDRIPSLYCLYCYLLCSLLSNEGYTTPWNHTS